MSELATLARPYAVAVYKRAKQTASTEKWSQMLTFLAAVMQDPRVMRAAGSPKIQKERFTQTFLEMCQGQLDTEAENFVRLLIANHRFGLIKSISKQFEIYKADEEGYVQVEVSSAYSLDNGASKQISTALKQVLGKEPRLNVQIDESLIGGVLIKAGDRVIDASIRGQVQRLAKRLYN
jgi:F-type H+-transporting ATPase subunit delta